MHRHCHRTCGAQGVGPTLKGRTYPLFTTQINISHADCVGRCHFVKNDETGAILTQLDASNLTNTIQALHELSTLLSFTFTITHIPLLQTHLTNPLRIHTHPHSYVNNVPNATTNQIKGMEPKLVASDFPSRKITSPLAGAGSDPRAEPYPHVLPLRLASLSCTSALAGAGSTASGTPYPHVVPTATAEQPQDPTKTTCSCGAVVLTKSLKAHMKTAKHLKIMENK